MLTRAERKFDITQGQTPASVAPGVYNNALPGPRPIRVVDGRAPFGSQGSRYQNSLYKDADAEWPAPEPAQYSVVDYDKPIVSVGGASMSNRSRRFVYPVAEGPDPASYHTEKPFVKPKRETGRPEAHSLMLTSRSRMPTAAPIPARWEVKGYTEDPSTGSLVKASPEPRMGNVGPASYGKIKISNKAPPGTMNFAKRSARRDVFSAKKRSGPAPGAYDNHIHAIAVTQPSRQPRELAPRFKSSTEQAPAPNAYDLKTSDFKKVDVPKTMQFFGTTSVRAGIEDVIKEKRDFPAPGYSDTRQSMGMAPVVRGEDRAMLQERRPFGQSTARFPRQRQVGPGPAGYSTESWFGGSPSVRDNVKASVLKSSTVAPFGGTGPRTAFNNLKRVGPPPGKYNTTEHKAIGSSGTAAVRGPFKSTTAVRATPKCVGPSPSAYDIRAAAGDIQAKVPPRNKNKLYVGSSERFQVYGTTQSGRLPDATVPAPNSYESAAPTKVVGGRILDHNKSRFGKAASEAPAPNAYHLKGTHNHSILKPSFNATFDRDEMSN